MATQAIHSDHLFAGEQIRQRLRDKLPAGLPVDGIEQLAQAGAEDLRPRAVYVMWDGERFSGVAPRAGMVEVVQTWLVLLHVRHASAHDKDARNGVAGPLLSQVHQALAGFTPTGAFRALERASGRRPSYTAQSALYPLAFELTLGL
jgi:hypothetical protein